MRIDRRNHRNPLRRGETIQRGDSLDNLLRPLDIQRPRRIQKIDLRVDIEENGTHCDAASVSARDASSFSSSLNSTRQLYCPSNSARQGAGSLASDSAACLRDCSAEGNSSANSPPIITG